MSNSASRPLGGKSVKRAFCRKLVVRVAFLASAAISGNAYAADEPAFRVIGDRLTMITTGPVRPTVLGTVALPIPANSASSRWSKIMAASLDQPSLFRLTFGAQTLQPQEQAAFVQSAVNRAVGGRTAHDCSDDGYWAAANETLGRGAGDCFDIAVAKMEALRLLGFQSDRLYLTTGYFSDRPGSEQVRESAALLVQIGDTFWLLSEQFDEILEVSTLTGDEVGFTPVLTYGVGKTWVHGKLAKTITVDDQNADRYQLWNTEPPPVVSEQQ